MNNMADNVTAFGSVPNPLVGVADTDKLGVTPQQDVNHKPNNKKGKRLPKKKRKAKS